MKTTKSEIRRYVERLQRGGFNIGVDSAYGEDALCRKDQSHNYTFRTSPSNNYNNIRAFEAGVNCERERIKKMYPILIEFLGDRTRVPNPEAGYPSLVTEMMNFLQKLERRE